MVSAHKDAGLSRGAVGPRMQRAGTLFTSEAASVVEASVSQVPLHEVNVLATDPADAADRASRSPWSGLWGWSL